MSNNNCINELLFLFERGFITKPKKCHKKSNCFVIHFSKCDFVSSSLDVSTDFDDSWNVWKKKIYDWKYANFVISLTKKKFSHSIYAKLIKIKINDICDSVKLCFKNDVEIPNDICFSNEECLECNINSFYDLKKNCYYNFKFFGDKNYKFKILI